MFRNHAIRSYGHFRPGDLVEVRSESRILATLDPDGKYEGLPFMPEMVKHCGRTFRVQGRVEKVYFDTRRYLSRMADTVLLEGLRCDGTAHGGCQAGCTILWKEVWLKPSSGAAGPSAPGDVRILNPASLPVLHQGAPNPAATGDDNAMFSCQATELTGATTPMAWWHVWRYWRDLFYGERDLRELAQMAVLIPYNRIRRRLGFHLHGKIVGKQNTTPNPCLNLQPGELVRVKTPDEIRATVDPVGRNRGLVFVTDMVRYCGRTYRVARRVDRMVSESSGGMRQFSNTVALEDVTCSGIPVGCCSRRCYHLWREAWLERVEAPPAPAGSNATFEAEPASSLQRRQDALPAAPRAGDSPVSVAPVKEAEIRLRFVRPGDRLWQECLDQMPHDFYHMPGYVRLSAEFEHGEPIAFFAEEGGNRLLVPLILRPIQIDGVADAESSDATSPYGYPSPLVHGAQEDNVSAAFLERALGLLLSELRARGVLSVFLRLHPILPLPQGPFRRHGVLVHHGETVFVDLTQSEEELWHQTRKNYRSRISRARESGAVAAMDQECNSLDDFIEIYWETMRSVAAADSYFFSRQYFYELKDVLDGALHLGTVRIGDSLACAGLFSEVGGIVEAHLVGSRREFARQEPMKLMMDFARRWAKDRGNRVLHLGGGRGAANDSLFQFKAGFSKLRSDFLSWRAITDMAKYNALVGRWTERHGVEPDGPEAFFPAYRKSSATTGVSTDPAEPLTVNGSPPVRETACNLFDAAPK
ncbi:MAG: GNAT family N-acetyltransferase [Pirellulales bacterium]|nr:GNAT family N-acetyltransferase [Pirellulales bacterium]